MKTAVILHGTLGSPDGNWFEWLKKELESRGYTVWLPQLPEADTPSLRNWAQYVREHCPFPINDETLIVGHSSGAILALVIAQSTTDKIGAIFGVSVFHDNSLRWEPNNKLFDVPFKWNAVRNGVNKLYVIHSDNDPYVPLDQAEYVAQQTGAEFVLITGQGHFNTEQSDAYRQFPELVRIIDESI